LIPMAFDLALDSGALDGLVNERLKPFVKKVDADAYYAESYLRGLGEAGWWRSQDRPMSEVVAVGARLVEETSKSCMTTGFNLWCHLAFMTYLRTSDNVHLRTELLPLMESGEKLGGTGLSNPMKYYVGLEKLMLSARRVEGGYAVSGQLGAVSNLGPDHWFGFVASIGEDRQIMAVVPCDAQGLTLKEKLDYIGLNGSATYGCKFEDVFIPDRWVISEQADEFVKRIRPAFLVYQVPLGLGVTEASIRAIEQAKNRQCGCNSYLLVQADALSERHAALRERLYRLVQADDLVSVTIPLMELRLEIAYLTLEAVQACMLHQGGPAYLQHSDASRRLREAYFLANLTPTVRHLEKALCLAKENQSQPLA